MIHSEDETSHANSRLMLHVYCTVCCMFRVLTLFPMVGLGVAPRQLLLLALIDCCVVPEMCVGVCKTWGDGG